MIRYIVMLLLLISACPSFAASIQVLKNCNTPLALPSLYTVLNSGRNTLSGWSHIRKETISSEFSLLKLNDVDYQISQNNYQRDVSCGDEKVQNAVLVVKLSDWTRQHSNGIEAILDSDKITFGGLTHVVFDIRVNSENTRILDRQGLSDRYGSYLTQSQLEKFDQGKVNLGITLFEEGALDQSTESFNAELFIEIDQALYFDRWVRVMMPLQEFNAYTEKGYQRVAHDLRDFSETNISGFRISPENSHGKQLRNFLREKWSTDIPETFKEMSISLRRIELISMN